MVLVKWLPYSHFIGVWPVETLAEDERIRAPEGREVRGSVLLAPGCHGFQLWSGSPCMKLPLGILVTTLISCLEGPWVVQLSAVASPRLPHHPMLLTSRLCIIPLLHPLPITPCEWAVAFLPALTDTPPLHR